MARDATVASGPPTIQSPRSTSPRRIGRRRPDRPESLLAINHFVKYLINAEAVRASADVGARRSSMLRVRVLSSHCHGLDDDYETA